MSKVRTIGGKTKLQFMTDCFIKATEINPGWNRRIFHFDLDDEDSATILTNLMWKNSADSNGFQLSITGDLFFKTALELDPYTIEVGDFPGLRTLNMSKFLPYPYTVVPKNAPAEDGGGRTGFIITLYSSEVAVWAALYGNDIDKLLEAYKTK